MPTPTRPAASRTANRVVPAAQRTADAGAPPGVQLAHALRYPLHGPALATLAVFTAGRMLDQLLPPMLGWPLAVLVWSATFLYALACLMRSADGYSHPPEVALEPDQWPGLALCLIQALGMALVILAASVTPLAWWLLAALIVVLPAMSISLAFGDGLLNPRSIANWGRAMAAFGPAYLLPVLLTAAQYLLVLEALRHGGVAGALLWSPLLFYVIVLNFHTTGALTHRHHADLGHLPQADALADITGRDADDELLDGVAALRARGEDDVARDQLEARLNERGVPVAVHAAYRDLLRRAGDREGLLQHAQPHIAALVAAGEPRRALGIAQECVNLDPQFMPNDPDITGSLADAAAQAGMARLALKLARGYPNCWPRAPQAPRYGLLAATLLADAMQQPAEAGVLAAKLADAYPDHPLRPDIDRLLQRLGMAPPGPGANHP